MTTDTLRDFGGAHRLNTSRDNCGELIIRGRQGQIYVYDDLMLGVMFLPEELRPRLWGVLRKRALSAGMTVIQNGDSEGCLAFSPDVPAQAELALKIARVKKRRKVSESRRQQLCEYLRKGRNLPPTAAGGELSA